MAALQGVYPASVIDNRDPDSLGRVLVRVPGVTDAVLLQCDTPMSDSVVSASDTPGAGNIW